MVDAERIVSGLIGLACLLMLVRLALGANTRGRLDRWFIGGWNALSTKFSRMYRRQVSRKEAEKATQEVLQRLMRQQVEREGNVITPKAFKRPDSNDQRTSRSDEE